MEDVKLMESIPKSRIKFTFNKDKNNARGKKWDRYEPNFFMKIDRNTPIDYEMSIKFEEIMKEKDEKKLMKLLKRKQEGRKKFYNKLLLIDRTREEVLNDANATRKNMISDWQSTEKTMDLMVKERSRAREQLGVDDFGGKTQGHVEKTMLRRMKTKWLNNKNRAHYEQLKDKMEEVRMLQREINKIKEYTEEQRIRDRQKVKELRILGRRNKSEEVKRFKNGKLKFSHIKSKIAKWREMSKDKMRIKSSGKKKTAVDLNFWVKKMVDKEMIEDLDVGINIDKAINGFDDLELEEYTCAYSEHLKAFEGSKYKKSEMKARKIRNRINNIYLKFGLTKLYSKMLTKKLHSTRSKSAHASTAINIINERGEVSEKVADKQGDRLFTASTKCPTEPKTIDDYFINSEIVKSLEPSLLTTPIKIKNRIVQGKIKVNNLNKQKKETLRTIVEDELYCELKDEALVEKKLDKVVNLITDNELRNIQKTYIDYQNEFSEVNEGILQDPNRLNQALIKSSGSGKKSHSLKRKIASRVENRFKLDEKKGMRHKTVLERHQRETAEDQILGVRRKTRPMSSYIGVKRGKNVSAGYIRTEIRAKSVKFKRPNSRHSSVLYLRNRDLEMIKENPDHTYHRKVKNYENRLYKKLGIKRPRSNPVSKTRASSSDIVRRKKKIFSFMGKINKFQRSIEKTRKTIESTKKTFDHGLDNVSRMNRKVDIRINKAIKDSIRDNNKKMNNNPKVEVLRKYAVKRGGAFSFFRNKKNKQVY